MSTCNLPRLAGLSVKVARPVPADISAISRAMRSIHCPSTPMSMTRSASTEPVSTAGATPCKGAADMTALASTNGAALGVSCDGAAMLASGIGDAPALSPADAKVACEDAELAERATGDETGDVNASAGADACGAVWRTTAISHIERA